MAHGETHGPARGGHLTTGAAPAEVVRVEHLRKAFVEGKLVLDDVDVAIEEGSVHALLGANGSGKSTLVKILAGYHQPDPGTSIWFDGAPAALPLSPEAVRAAGLRFVHQNQQLVPGLSLVDNMRLGTHYTCGPGWRIRWRKDAEAVKEGFGRFRIDVDPRADVEGLSPSTVTKLVIARALQHAPGEQIRLVVLDEPTATLSEEDAAELLSWVRELAHEESVAVLFVSHRLSEVRSVADHMTVLRNGGVVAAGPMADFDEESIVDAIVGYRIDSYYPLARTRTVGEPLLTIGGLGGATVVDESLVVRSGEIVGLTGLEGSGFDEVPYLLGDVRPTARGDVVFAGKPLDVASCSVDERVRRGLVLVPGDRAKMAVVPDVTIRENVVLPRLAKFYRVGMLRKQRETVDVLEVMRKMGVVPPEPEMPLGQLSGGNQQKVVLGKWMATSPTVLLLHEPTQGVDVGARREIFGLLVAFAEAGGAVVVASGEYEDLAHICNRVVVFGRGRIYSELSGEGLTTQTIMATAYEADSGWTGNGDTRRGAADRAGGSSASDAQRVG